MEIVLREFHIYFRYKKSISQPANNSVIIAHVMKNYAGWLYEMRQRAVRIVVDQPGITIRDHQPQIVSDAAWEAMCSYWDVDDFKKKSEHMKKNRGQLRIVHTIGSQSFEEAMRTSLGRPSTMVEF